MKSDCRIRPEALDAYFHGMLNEAQQREISAHLLTCAACNAALGMLEAEAYTIGKGLRDVQIPAMSLSAADLVSRFAGTQPPDATTVELSTAEHARLDVPVRRSNKRLQPVQPQAPKPLLLRISGRTLSTAWSLARSRTLRYVAALAAICAVAIWYAKYNVQQINQLSALQSQQLAEIQRLELKQEADRIAAVQRDHESEDRFFEYIRTVVEPMQQKVEERLTLLKEREEKRDEITELKSKLKELGAKIDAKEADAVHDREKLMAQLAQREQEMGKKEQELAQATQSLKDIRNRPEAALAERNALALLPGGDAAITWDELKSATATSALSTLRDRRGEAVGWSVSLYQTRPPSVNEEPGSHQGAADFPLYLGPAVSNGKLFVGNGWNGNEMLGFNSTSGELSWSYKTSETGVGMPILSDDGRYVYFTTRNQLYSIQTNNGHEIWKDMLGEISTHPALRDKYIYVVHSNENCPPGYCDRDKKGPFSITCFETGHGKDIWSKGLAADAITAPIVVEGQDHTERVVVTTRDGMISVFDAKNGLNGWTSAAGHASSAPVISHGTMYVTSWSDSSDSGFEESLMKLSDASGDNNNLETVTGPFPAMYLTPGASLPVGNDCIDRAVHREKAGPAFRQPWSYLGGHPTIVDDTAYVALGDQLVSVDLRAGKLNWSKKILGKADNVAADGQGQGQPVLTPPSYAADRLYMGSIWGDMLCVDAHTGATNWQYRLGSEGVTSQVMLDQGNAYATTTKGNLICINTKDASATGWTSFGGSASHNGTQAANPTGHFRK